MVVTFVTQTKHLDMLSHEKGTHLHWARVQSFCFAGFFFPSWSRWGLHRPVQFPQRNPTRKERGRQDGWQGLQHPPHDHSPLKGRTQGISNSGGLLASYCIKILHQLSGTADWSPHHTSQVLTSRSLVCCIWPEVPGTDSNGEQLVSNELCW